jgi:hypothetical protein
MREALGIRPPVRRSVVLRRKGCEAVPGGGECHVLQGDWPLDNADGMVGKRAGWRTRAARAGEVKVVR